MHTALAVLLGLVVLLAGCDQQAMVDKFMPKEEAAVATKVLAQIRAREYTSVEQQLDPTIRGVEARTALEQIAQQFPPGEPKTSQAVGVQTMSGPAATTYNLTFEYEYPDSWVLANVVLQRKGEQLTVIGIHANAMPSSMKDLNRFTFEGKSALHYIVFALTVGIPVFVVYALFRCFRTPIPRRKWLWYVFIALGVVRLSFNWTDGAFDLQLLSAQLLGAGFNTAGPYGPLVLQIAIPLGAIVFLARREALPDQTPP